MADPSVPPSVQAWDELCEDPPSGDLLAMVFTAGDALRAEVLRLTEEREECERQFQAQVAARIADDERLRAENLRLREALQRIASWDKDAYRGELWRQIARAALRVPADPQGTSDYGDLDHLYDAEPT